MARCSLCGAERPAPAGPCPKCGDDPAVVPQDPFDKPVYRLRAGAGLIVAAVVAAALLGSVIREARYPRDIGDAAPSVPLGSADGPPKDPLASAVTSPLPETLWVFEGTVLALGSLEPLGGTILRFTTPAGGGRDVEAGPDGRYRAELPAIPGGEYLLTPSRRGWSEDHLVADADGLKALRALSSPRRVRGGFDEGAYHAAWSGLPDKRPLERTVLLVRDPAR